MYLKKDDIFPPAGDASRGRRLAGDDFDLGGQAEYPQQQRTGGGCWVDLIFHAQS